MEYGWLGRTEVKVSRLALGTVELGLDYGFRDSSHYRKPEAHEAIRLIHRALDLGINLIDTARGYGGSEELIGKALKECATSRPLIASKVAVPDRTPEDAKNARKEILASIEASLRALQVETIDLLQIHNTSARILATEEAIRTLDDLRVQGKARFVGVSCDDEAVSLQALEMTNFRALQTPFNLLNRTIVPRVMPLAAQQGVGILVRSVFLRGILTDNVQATPASLSGLRDAALAIWKQFKGEARSLSELALRFCLSFEEVSSVIIGVRSITELEANIADASQGRLSPEQLDVVCRTPSADPALLDPRQWGGLV
jgi:1-deoxyxylulose-5-phosphate synthase